MAYGLKACSCHPLMPFLSFSDNLLQDAYHFSKVLRILRYCIKKHILSFDLRVYQFPLKSSKILKSNMKLNFANGTHFLAKSGTIWVPFPDSKGRCNIFTTLHHTKEKDT